MFLKVGDNYHEPQRLYLLEIQIPKIKSKPIYKIGKASGVSAKKRMLQICGSIFDKSRETPIIKILRDRKIPDEDDAFKIENILHRFFNKYKYIGLTFDGCTECFTIDKDTAIQAYEAAVIGHEPEFEFCYECDKLPDYIGHTNEKLPERP